jgi:putative N6-adenine-specific DNA methylase
MYKANLSLRTALKIFIFLRQLIASLIQGISGVNWSRYINANQTFVIDATLHSDNFTLSLSHKM